MKVTIKKSSTGKRWIIEAADGRRLVLKHEAEARAKVVEWEGPRKRKKRSKWKAFTLEIGPKGTVFKSCKANKKEIAKVERDIAKGKYKKFDLG